MTFATTFIDNYKTKNTLQDRQYQSSKMLEKGLIPIIAFPGSQETPYPLGINKDSQKEYMKTKYIVSQDKSFGEFMSGFRKGITVNSDKGLFFSSCSGIMLVPNQLMSQIYQRFKDEDGFLYIIYTCENTFGY